MCTFTSWLKKKIFWHLKPFISNQFILKSFIYKVHHLWPELNRLRFSVVVWSKRLVWTSGVRFGEAFGPTEKWWPGTYFWSCAKILVMTKTAILYEYSNTVIFRLTNIYNVYIYFMVKEENILTFKTVYFQSIHFKIIRLQSPPSLTRAEPTEILSCSLVRTSGLNVWSPTGPGHDRQNSPLKPTLQHRHTHSPPSNAWRPWLIILWYCVGNHIEYRQGCSHAGRRRAAAPGTWAYHPALREI